MWPNLQMGSMQSCQSLLAAVKLPAWKHFSGMKVLYCVAGGLIGSHFGPRGQRLLSLVAQYSE